MKIIHRSRHSTDKGSKPSTCGHFSTLCRVCLFVCERILITADVRT